MEIESKIRLGFIGGGSVVKECLGPAFRNNERFDIVAVSDTDIETGKGVAKEFDIPQFYSNYLQMLDSERLDAVVIGTPPFLHKPMTIDCLQRGLHVFCEKPPALNATETQDMVRQAKESGKFLHFGMCYRHMDNTIKLRETVLESKLGKLYYGKAGWLNCLKPSSVPPPENWWHQKSCRGGGILRDAGVHTIDRTLWSIGYPEPVSVYGKTFDCLGKALVPETTVEDLAVGFVNFKNGFTLYIENSAIQNGPEGYYYNELFGVDGGMGIYRDKKAVFYQRDEHELKAQELVDNLEFEPEIIYQRQADSFADSIEKGIVEHAQHDELIMLMKIIDGLYDSAEKGELVCLNR